MPSDWHRSSKNHAHTGIVEGINKGTGTPLHGLKQNLYDADVGIVFSDTIGLVDCLIA